MIVGGRTRFLVLATASVLTGCDRELSATNTAGPQAGRIADLLSTYIWVLGVVFVLVLVATAIALVRARSRAAGPRDVPPLEEPLAGPPMAPRAIVGAATGATVLIVFVLLAQSVSTGRELSAFGRGSHGVTVDLIGHQWWWEVQVPGRQPNETVTTANEIHIPVAEPVRFRLTSRDVIHSLWVPRLQGKADLLPGYQRTTVIRADRVGRYRGECAEFCGAEHARMGLVVMAEPRAEFEAWLRNQRKSAVQPTNELARRGEQVFLTRTCPMCHTIAGTRAGSTIGPDLTHVASRGTIAAGALQNRPDRLARWITDPQRLKPGTRMPANPMPRDDLQALVTYLGGLR